MSRLLIVGILLLTPALALGAGFASQSVFLSHADPHEGDKILIHVVVRNDTLAAFDGTLTVTTPTGNVGTSPVSLDAGAADTVSIPWAPSAGTHILTARLESEDSDTVQDSATFFIKPRAAPATATPTSNLAAVESSQSIQTQISSISPQVGSAAAPVFGAIDSLRESIANVADTQLAQVEPKIKESSESGGSGWSILYTLYFYILTLMKFVVSSAAIFYPLFALTFLYFIWKMFRFYRRPR